VAPGDATAGPRPARDLFSAMSVCSFLLNVITAEPSDEPGTDASGAADASDAADGALENDDRCGRGARRHTIFGSRTPIRLEPGGQAYLLLAEAMTCQ
jgi:hypothetical protein